jgi:hypothetical protein
MNCCADETLTSAPISWVQRALERLEMPPDEISAILATDEPEMVRRYLELHRERLEEHLADRLGELDAVETELVGMTQEGRDLDTWGRGARFR